MSYEAYNTTRSILINSDVTDYIPSNFIRIGYSKDITYVPSITIAGVDGSTGGYLGYRTAPSGERLRRENVILQVDLYQPWTIVSSQRIGEIINKTLIYGNSDSWYSKISDNDNYNNSLNCHTKTQRWSYSKNVED